MQGIRSWVVLSVLIAAACGGRTALELLPNDSNGSVHSGGAASIGGSRSVGGSLGAADSPNAAAAANTGGSPNASGATSAGGTPSAGAAPAFAAGNANGGVAGTPATSLGGRGTAGQASVTSQHFATGVSAGNDTTCATERDGGVWCWGFNEGGPLGDVALDFSALPIRVPGVDSALTVTTGGTCYSGSEKGAVCDGFACAALRDGTVECWGDPPEPWWVPNTDIPLLQPVPQINDATALAAGNWHACALASGSVLCWGDNSRGQLGNGVPVTCSGSDCAPGTANPTEPVRVLGMEGATAIAGTECDFSCAVLPDASVWCWGALPGSTDGDGSSASPVMVPGVSATAHGIAAGFGHACAVSPSGAVQCWGSNTHGELGDGTTFASFTPVSVRGLAGAAIAVTAGSVHSCALLADSTVQCWGDNTWGQLGSGDFEPSRLPVAVSGLVDAVAVSAGVSHTCALTRAGGVRCWGNNDVGQLGAGDMNGSHVASPVAVLGF